MTGEEKEPETIAKIVPESELKKPLPLRYICIKDTDMPGVGLFVGGDVITDPFIITKISDNPHFKKIDQEEK